MTDYRAKDLEPHLTRLMRLLDTRQPGSDPEALGQAEVDVSDLATNAPQGSDMKRLASELIAQLGNWYGGRQAATNPGEIKQAQSRLKDQVQALYAAALDRR